MMMIMVMIMMMTGLLPGVPRGPDPTVVAEQPGVVSSPGTRDVTETGVSSMTETDPTGEVS